MDIKKILFSSIRTAEKIAPNALGFDKRKLATTYILGVVEGVDNLLPSIGAFMDLPVVDGMQHKVIEAAVEWGFAYLTIKKDEVMDDVTAE